MSEEDDDVFPRFGSLSLDDDDSTNFRRSLTDLDDPQDNSSSLEQEKADAEKDWEQFVASTPDEDLDSYPDSFAQDVDSNSSCSDEATDSTDASKDLVQFGCLHASTQSRCRGTQAKQVQALRCLEKKGSPGSQPAGRYRSANEADAAQRKQAEVDKQKKERKAAEDKEAEAAKAKKEPIKPTQPRQPKKPPRSRRAQPPQSQDNDQTKDVSSIPGTSVQTGTVHKDHKGDSYSAPSSEEHTGDATYYEPGMGACGLTNNSGDMIVAVSKLLYDSFPSERGNPNTNKVCGKRIRATYKGKSCDLTVVDRCEGCLHDDLDMTITAF
ncbi:hypothetical protein PSHT_02310 [Puccinia striiformis]|uniref:RlpA-like protein double-psi beta-barrel domain-containing protein n=1 Tax=Puccinia striiformis TaxID=27350 RepID=A0A2S4WIJ0_9BASI|nr:hypothetical protein PSHT_02310 [Puccinia striiformis]